MGLCNRGLRLAHGHFTIPKAEFAVNGHDVFISYASEDQTIADAAVHALEAKGIRCWIAHRDIPGGADWARSIISAIDQCGVLVLIFSSAINKSSHVPREIERAASKGLVIVPLRVESASPEGTLEYFLSSVHWLDALTPPREAAIGRLVDQVRAVLGAGEAPAGAEPDSRKATGTAGDDTERAAPQPRQSRPGCRVSMTVALAAAGALLTAGLVGSIWLVGASDFFHDDAAHVSGHGGKNGDDPDPDDRPPGPGPRPEDAAVAHGPQPLGPTPAQDAAAAREAAAAAIDAVADARAKGGLADAFGALDQAQRTARELESAGRFAQAITTYERATKLARAIRTQVDALDAQRDRPGTSADPATLTRDAAEALLADAAALIEAGDYYKASRLLAPAAEAFADDARFANWHDYALGVAKLRGLGAIRDQPGGLRALGRASERGLIEASLLLAHTYETGTDGVEPDDRQARAYYHAAAQAGSPLGMVKLATFWREGRGGPADPEQARVWAMHAAQKGVGYGYVILGELESVDRRKFGYFEKAAELGAPLGHFHVGYCYYHGIGAAQDKAAAFASFERAAKNADASVLYQIARLYAADADHDRARYFLRLAEQAE